MRRVLLAGLLATNLACGASISRSAHEAALDQERTRYEALLAQARRRQAAAEDERAACLTSSAEGAQAQARRFARLERSLADKEIRLMTWEAGKVPTTPSLPARALDAAASRLGAEVRPEGDALRLVIPARALFREGEASLLPTAGPGLDALAEALVEARARARVEGYTAETASEVMGQAVSADDWAQASALAAAVVRGLQVRGVDPSRLAVVGYGAHRPGSNGEAARVEVVVRVGPGA
ncbi:MAG: OmpA family protein [Deltaproteobacteria bacterium]|nr:OmpA family protein [Deltaproteobacteria bacterium]